MIKYKPYTSHGNRGIHHCSYGIIYTIATYQKTVVAPEMKAKELLTEKFEFGKKFNGKMLDKLVAYANEAQAHAEIFMQGLTIKQSIDILQEYHGKIFSIENKQAIK